MKNSEEKNFEHPFHGEEHGEFTWCLHCERVHKTEKWVERDWDCPEEGCDGNALDAHPWRSDNWPRSANPDYPVIPVEGEQYPLYGGKKR